MKFRVVEFEGTPEEFEVVKPHLGESTPNEEAVSVSETNEPVEPEEAIRRMLTRRPISNGQRALYEALSEGRLAYDELLERTGRTGQQMAGLLGALGSRINSTRAIHQAGLPGNVGAVLKYERIDGERHLSLTPDAREALEAEGVI
ncbi:MAG: hypothetical protein ACOC58_03385 [Chloroflexota bacterium]